MVSSLPAAPVGSGVQAQLCHVGLVPHGMGGILAPQPGVKPRSPALGDFLVAQW